MFRGWAARPAWGALALLVLGLLAAGGAASRPGGLWLGAPRASAALLVAAGVALLAWLTRAELSVAAGLVLLPLAVALAPELPGLRALTGPPLFAVALAGGVAALTRSPARAVARALFFPIVLGVYLTMAARVQSRVGPNGDEPHYLMVAESLIRDGDVDLTRDYAEGRYRAFHPEPLEPHFRVRGSGGEIYSLHALGLSLLVLPAYGLFGYAGASYFMALLAALLAREIRGLARDSETVAWAVALSPPLVHYAGLVFTEVPAALGLAFALRRASRVGDGSVREALSWGAALAFLPWLNVRYAVFPVIVLLYALSQRPVARVMLAAAAPCAVSAMALAAYHRALYGFFDPSRVYGRRPELSPAALGEGLPGLLLDQEFGLLVYAPVFAFAAPGLVRLMRDRPREAALVASLAGVALLTAGSWPMWRGGFNPPARFLVPLVPALAVALGAALGRGLGAPATLLVGFGLWCGLGGVARPELVHRDRDGTAPFFRELSGAAEWTRLLPGYVLADADRHRLAALWGGALALAVLVSGRKSTARGLLAAVAGLALATSGAAGLSHARSEARDALRVLGRPALTLPGIAFTRSAPAEWDAQDLAWGPLYEPHRHPDGATLAGRARLPPARVEIETDAALPIGDPPALVIREESPHAPREARLAMSREGARLTATLRVEAPVRPVKLALEGGSPFLLRRVLLSALEPATGPGR
ncbi:MAG TPA: hypothetical protein VFM88_06965 [Vicinamibacteria bacterium]|nr:hypothetical protein [Vicinamibacteria bacterium]